MNLLRDPITGRNAADDFAFLSDTNAENVLHFCRAAKAASDSECIVGTSYGYLLNTVAGYAGGWAPVHWGH